jgi:aminoglycoside 2'-N-acetyltransferase I
MDRGRVRDVASHELTDDEVVRIRALLDVAFGDDPEEAFSDEDWEHALGGRHFLVELDGDVVAHAAVVPRELHVHGTPVRTGYVEAVATDPSRQGGGFGTAVMRAAGDHIRATYELGALGTGLHHFYERLGWRTWQGSTSVRTDTGERPTPDEDGYVMVLTTDATDRIDLTAPLSCDWRPGDVW